MTDVFSLSISFIFGGIAVALCFIFNIFRSRDDGFDQAFDEEAKKVLSTLKEEEKVKNKPKANKTKNDGSQKPKKPILTVSQLLDRLNNSDLEPECSTFLSTHLEKLNSQVSSLTEAREAANDQRTTMGNRIEEHKTARVAAETKLAVMKQEISDLNKKLKEATASEQRLNDSVASLTKQNNDLVEAAIRSKEVLAKLKSAESALTLRIRDMEYALEKANTAVENLSEDLSREVADHHTTKQELDHLRKEFQQLSEVAASAEARADGAEEAARMELVELQKKFEEEKNAWHMEEDRFRSELSVSKRLVGELSGHVDQLPELNRQLSAAHNQMDLDKSAMDDLRAFAEMQDKEILKLRSEKDEMEKQISSLKEEVAAGKDLVVVETVNDDAGSVACQNAEEIASLKEDINRLKEKNQELRNRNMKILADFASMTDQMKSLSESLESQESAMHEEADHVKRMVVDVFSSMAPQPLDDLENDKFSSWLSSIATSATSATCCSILAAGDSAVAPLAMDNENKTRALIQTLAQLERAVTLLDEERRDHKEERRSHKEEILALKGQLCKSNIDSLHSSVSDAINSLQ